MEKRIDKYLFNMNSIIGKGSFGTVYRGRNMETNEIVAIKVME